MPLTASIAVNLAALLSGAVDIGEVSHKIQFGPSANFTDGAGANQASVVYADTRALAASGAESLDLSGALVDAIGAAVVLTKVKGLLIRAAAGNANDVVVGGAAANAFAAMFGAATDKLKIKPGGFIVLAAPGADGYAVTPGTGDLLQIANGGAGTPVTYDVVIIGA